MAFMEWESGRETIVARGGAGNMLGVGGARRNIGRQGLRGAERGGRVGGGADPQAQKRELLRQLRAKHQEQEQEEGQGKAQE